MSKTDKTQPPWYDCEWEPTHYPGCPNRTGPRYGWYPPRPCDLPPEPPRRELTPKRRSRGCTWQPDVPHDSKRWPRRQYVQFYANYLERSTRMKLRVYRQKILNSPNCPEGCSACEHWWSEFEPPDPRHRHNVLWWD